MTDEVQEIIDVEEAPSGPSAPRSSRLYGTTQRLADEAQALIEGVQDGSSLLTLIIILSGILSAIFFWQYSSRVFTNVWPPLALLLGLAVGLAPAEGAFFGWKRVRKAKRDMTKIQLQTTTHGILAAILASVFSTFALFVVSFDAVPEEIRQYSTWFVFVALGVPIIAQVVLIARFSTNERAVIENYAKSQLNALGFDAYLRAEQAKAAAIIRGMDVALDRQLQEFGDNIGADEAANLLNDGSQRLLNIGRQAQTAPQPAPTRRTQWEHQDRGEIRNGETDLTADELQDLITKAERGKRAQLARESDPARPTQPARNGNGRHQE